MTTFVKKSGGWQDSPSAATPLSAAALNDFDDRIGTAVSGLDAVAPTAGQKAALAGNGGTPAAANPYLTLQGLVTGVHVADLYANRPAASATLNGMRFFATDKMIEYQCVAAAWVIVSILAPEVTSLPASPVDQQACVFIADATNGIKWQLRYRAASASAYKWECVNGASPLTSEVAASEATTSTVYVDLTTVGPQVTVPLAGDYMIEVGATVNNNTANNSALIAPKIGAASALDADGTYHTSATASAVAGVWRSVRRNGLAASAVVKLQYRAGPGGTASFFQRNIEVRPVRVG